MAFSVDKIMEKITLAALLLTGVAQVGIAQTSSPAAGGGEPSWYVGVLGGTSFGQGTFRSITEHNIHWGAQGGVLGGYRFNRLLSVEAGLQLGTQTQSALDCCTYWLNEDGTRYMSPVLDETGWYYHNFNTRTQWGKVALQANADLLSLFTKPGNKWSLNVGPQLSAVTTKTRFTTPDKTISHDRQWHLGIGGQVSVGYRISERIGASLYGGATCLTGDRFDNLPRHAHKSNLIWDTGVKITFKLGKKRAKASPVVTPVPAVQPAPVAEPQPEPVVEPEPAVEPEPEPVVVETTDPVKEHAFSTPIPNVFFSNNSAKIGEAPQLEMALAILQQYPDFNLEIHAYCSKSGTKEYNDKLSQRRMEAIRNWFTERGISKDRMDNSYWHGIDYNAPSAKQARRAELRFVK